MWLLGIPTRQRPNTPKSDHIFGSPNPGLLFLEFRSGRKMAFGKKSEKPLKPELSGTLQDCVRSALGPYAPTYWMLDRFLWVLIFESKDSTLQKYAWISSQIAIPEPKISLGQSDKHSQQTSTALNNDVPCVFCIGGGLRLEIMCSDRYDVTKCVDSKWFQWARNQWGFKCWALSRMNTDLVHFYPTLIHKKSYTTNISFFTYILPALREKLRISLMFTITQVPSGTLRTLPPPLLVGDLRKTETPV